MTKRLDDEERKRQIRDAATRCFARRGFAATRLSDIAREAGLSKGGLYFHYPTKETIFRDILDGLSRSHAARWGFELAGGQSAERTLTRVVVAHARTLQDEPDEVHLQNLLVTMAAQDPMVRAKLDEVIGVTLRLYREVIERGIAEGAFAVEDSEPLARSVVAYLTGLATLAAVTPGGRLPVTPEQAATTVLRMVKGHSRASAVEFGSSSAN